MAKIKKYTADVIVIGSGAAGMMAALTVAKAGKKCIILEKGTGISASNAAKAGGPSLAGTKYQREAGVMLTPVQLYQHMFQFSRGTVNAGLLRRVIEKGAEVEEIFDENGILMELLPDTYGVGFRGRHFFKLFGEKRWQPLADALTNMGGEIHFSVEAKTLLMENGRVVGVESVACRYYGDSVIIATGGYLGSTEMIKEHFGNTNIIALGSTLSNGAGIAMAVAAGGIKDRNFGICANEFGGANTKLLAAKKRFSTNLVYAICGGLLVNSEGLRFMNEQFQSDEPLAIGGEMTLRAGKFYAVLDDFMYQALMKETLFDFYGRPECWHAGKTVHSKMQKHKEEDLKEDIENGWAFCADTIEEIAQAFSLEKLSATVNTYNAMCKQGEDAQFGKSGYLMKPINKAPFYVFEYEPSAWCTLGGVKTDEFCRLLDKNQKVIEGVYAAGMDNGSCFTTPYYDNEGAALGLSLTMGVLAGEQAAKQGNKTVL